MTALPCQPSASQAASQILRLLRRAGPEEFGAELQRMGRAGGRAARASGLAGERWELLEAITEEMGAALPASRRASLETCLRLLRHLAGESVPRRPAPRLRRLPRPDHPPGRPSCSRL